jgi:hypothetical protein
LAGAALKSVAGIDTLTESGRENSATTYFLTPPRPPFPCFERHHPQSMGIFPADRMMLDIKSTANGGMD